MGNAGFSIIKRIPTMNQVLENGSVIAWGDPECGGDTSHVAGQLKRFRV